MSRKRSDRSDPIASQATGAAEPAERDVETVTVSLSEVAYERILDMLFGRELPAGAFVSQNDLVKLIGVPVAPLRDALRVLQTEGLLTIHPRSGIRFLKADFELARNTYQLRAILERPAVRVFAETAEPALLDALVARHERAIEALERDGFTQAIAPEIVAIDAALHVEIIAALGNPLIVSTHRRVHNYLQLIRLDRTLSTPIVMRTLREHMTLLEACKARDADAAETALQAHFSNALQRTLGIF
ncbi:GntR family transcriptional regulator [Kaistia nematophila]|uniref:GntR family transcriptional regulator n=1 Tax=Kaistia nematophila TaxID=2994654 RepID=A0A9X3E0W4_9HYPH|nr:GntR family transcriptional regulator [Kaistia nematophila]MBN9026300.1 GntR family transcriptional regulator [Hyphomicrobiales bacterium]MCX5568973.1 GntR family transcriptional regulator [Kaistia nematophila]